MTEPMGKPGSVVTLCPFNDCKWVVQREEYTTVTDVPLNRHLPVQDAIADATARSIRAQNEVVEKAITEHLATHGVTNTADFAKGYEAGKSYRAPSAEPTMSDRLEHVAPIRKAIQDAGYGAQSLIYALRAETTEGGALYDHHYGYMNPALALEFGHLLAKCPAQYRAVIRMTTEKRPSD